MTSHAGACVQGALMRMLTRMHLEMEFCTEPAGAQESVAANRGRAAMARNPATLGQPQAARRGSNLQAHSRPGNPSPAAWGGRQQEPAGHHK